MSTSVTAKSDTADITVDLVRKAQRGDEQALHRLLKALEPAISGTAWSVAQGQGWAAEELKELGTTAIWESLAKYDHTKSSPRTYFARVLTWTMRTAYNDLVRGGVGVGTSVDSRFRKLREACDDDLSEMLERASEFEISHEALVGLYTFQGGVDSYDAYMEDEESEYPLNPAHLEIDSDPDPLQSLLREETAVMIREYLGHSDIPQRWSFVLQATFGIYGLELSDAEIAEKLDISQSRVRSIRSSALRRMRAMMAAQVPYE